MCRDSGFCAKSVRYNIFTNGAPYDFTTHHRTNEDFTRAIGQWKPVALNVPLNHRPSQGAKGPWLLRPQISIISLCFVLREWVSRTEYCCSLKLKIFGPSQIFGLALLLHWKIFRRFSSDCQLMYKVDANVNSGNWWCLFFVPNVDIYKPRINLIQSGDGQTKNFPTQRIFKSVCQKPKAFVIR